MRKACLILIAAVSVSFGLLSLSADEEALAKTPNVFDLPRLHAQQVISHRQAAVLLLNREYAKAEEVLTAAIERMPHDRTSHYNLACVLARQSKTEEAFEHLEEAIELGWRNRQHIEKNAHLESLRKDKRFDEVLKAAEAPPLKQAQGWKFSVTPAEAKDGQVLVEESCTAYDAKTGLLRVFLRPEKDTGKQPIAKGFGKAGEWLVYWMRKETAAGNAGDFYDNHDSDHSNMNVAAFPQLTRIEFSDSAKKRGLHHGLQQRFLYNSVVIGNSSTALVSGTQWRSQGRFALTRPGGPGLLAVHYLSNHLYFYPEHRDHDVGHNGANNGGHGDVFPANTPYLIISQGSSGSDRAFLNAVAATLAAFRPEVKEKLKSKGLLMPAVQMIFRTSNKQVETLADYRTGKAHPTVFDGKKIDAVKMVKMAQAMEPDSLPPLCQIAVVEEDFGTPGRDYFDIAPREKLFDTPCAVARVVKSSKYARRMVVSAEKSLDLNGKPLKFHWVVLRGDAERISIKPLNDSGSRAELVIPYHTRRPVSENNELESNRVDIGVFAHNGDYDSPPAFVSLYYLDNELRIYDQKQRIQSVDYADESASKNYVDPLLDFPKDWRDDYHYDGEGRLTGWTRTRGNVKEEFTAEGKLIVAPAKPGEDPQTAEVRYTAERLPNGRFKLKQEIVN